jgi:malonyl-CoA O-methyltransferase
VVAVNAPGTVARPVREAYALWADQYLGETAVSALEDHAVAEIGPSLEGRRVLDAGCGTGRRLAGVRGARLAVGVDLVPEMLSVGRGRWPLLSVAAGDLRALPLGDAHFDAVWCRLALGHAPAIETAYRELGRVSRPAATLVVTDFHPEAVRAGHRRTFKDGEGRVHEVEHYVHDVSAHERAARAGRWELEERRDAVIGPLVRSYYEEAGAGSRYREQEGRPLVLALRFRRAG